MIKFCYNIPLTYLSCCNFKNELILKNDFKNKQVFGILNSPNEMNFEVYQSE